MNLDFLHTKFVAQKSSPAILWNDKYQSYGQLTEMVDEMRHELIKVGIEQGAVVAVVSDFCPPCIATLLALIELNAIVVPLMYHINEEEKQSKLEISQARHEVNINPKDGAWSITKLDQEEGNHELYLEIEKRNTCGLLLFSSGTSGKPKAALHDFSKLLDKFKVERKCLRTINFLMFDHWGGLNTLFYTLSNTGLVLTINDRKPEGICAFIEEHTVELLPVSPSFLNLLILSEAYKRFDLSSLQLITYGTEPMPQHTLNQAKRVFPNVKFLQTYGLIELGVLRSKSKDDDSLWVKLGGEGFDLRIADGILQIKAESAMLGYLNAPSPFTEDGYFITGDMALEKDGYYRILGRKSELINVGGEKVYPQEVEDVILELGEIAEVTVFGQKNMIMGMVVAAKVVPRVREFDQRQLIKLIKSHCKKRLQSFKVPVKIEVTTESLTGLRMKKSRFDL